MKRTFRYDATADMFYEVGGNYFEPEAPRSASVISDDVGAGVAGLRHMPSGKMLDSKSAHRRENRARGLEEVGNERNFASKRERPGEDYYTRQVRDAREQIERNWNGTADWLQRQKERS